MDLAPSLSIDLLLPLEELKPAPVRPTRWIIRGDEELQEYGYQSRTSPRNETGTINYACTPSVFRFYREPIDKQGDFRVDISPLESAYCALNGEDSREDPKSRYLFHEGTALFNQTGYPMQAYITMSGNELVGERVGEWFRFETLRPTDNVSGMTHETHPHFVHRFDLVCWNDAEKRTYHKPVRYGWEIYFYLVSKEGYGWIPSRYVKEV